MEVNEHLAQVVAVVNARNTDVSQPERTMMMVCDGLDVALDRLYGSEFFAYDEAIEQAREQVLSWQQQGVNVVSILDDDYPRMLSTVYQAPALVFYQGALLPEDDGVAVVGSRKITPRQAEIAAAVARCVTSRGLTVVSGLAAGVDSCAHGEALRHGARTVAVMGTPIEKTYPRENSTLRREICSRGGMVMTQFFPGSATSRASFPIRNVTMSGYARCTVIVAATEQSGTRHQALAARSHGRPVILLDEVVREASWARKLVGSAGVFVVSGLEDLQNAFDVLDSDRELLGLFAGA